MALTENPDLSNFIGSVQDSGEGRWFVAQAFLPVWFMGETEWYRTCP
jgi:6-phosphogluconate dehydrogenase (decarboxylating)